MRRVADARVEVEFCDLPKVEGAVGTLMLRQMLAVAELEAGMISERTKKALAAAKARGAKLGGDRGNLPAVGDKGRALSLKTRQQQAQQKAADLAPIIKGIQASGITSANGIAKALNDEGIPTSRGGTWQASQVLRMLARLCGD